MALQSLHNALGLQGSASADEIKAVYRSLAQRCQPGAQPSAELLERLQLASIALGQELAHAGYDQVFIYRALTEEGCPVEVATVVARAAGGRFSRVVPGIERSYRSPEDAAYARLAARTRANQAMMEARGTGFGFGFLAKLAVVFVLSIGALYLALHFVPRALHSAADASPAPPQKAEMPAMPVHLVPEPRRAEVPEAAPVRR